MTAGGPDQGKDDANDRTERVKLLITARFRAAKESARAAEREHLEHELSQALGVPPGEFAWSSLIPMVAGASAIAERVMASALALGTADAYVDSRRRDELLVMLGIAEDAARVREEADRVGERLRADPEGTVAGFELREVDAAAPEPPGTGTPRP